jgi:hypothetical protein
MTPGELLPELAPDEQSPLRVDREDAAGAETAAPHGLALGKRDRAGLGRDGDEISRDREAQRAKPVAVQRGARDPSVGEDERGRAVPRLAEHGVEAVQLAHLGV